MLSRDRSSGQARDFKGKKEATDGLAQELLISST